MKNNQIILKPQDLLVAVKLTISRIEPFSYASLGKDLGFSASEAHGAVVRARQARLVSTNNASDAIESMPHALLEFIVHGVMFAFPAIRGTLTQGMPTAYGASLINEMVASSNEPPPVWPHSAAGAIKGIALYPLYPSVPMAAERDRALYEALALIDSIRIGGARERRLAISELEKRLL